MPRLGWPSFYFMPTWPRRRRRELQLMLFQSACIGCPLRPVESPRNCLFPLLLLAMGLVGGVGCAPLAPRSIPEQRYYQSSRLPTDQPQIQRGRPRPVIDTVGWVIGIPNKILLWDRRVDNHSISYETELSIAEYVERNNLSTVRVRLNQYRPGEDWGRLVRNDSVGAPWRFTFGALSVLGETLLPGRIFGGDHYNPYTDTIHIYSDIPAVALHEGGHAKDFARRKWKGTYAFAYALPLVPLYHESKAAADVIAHLETHGTPQQQARRPPGYLSCLRHLCWWSRRYGISHG